MTQFNLHGAALLLLLLSVGCASGPTVSQDALGPPAAVADVRPAKEVSINLVNYEPTDSLLEQPRLTEESDADKGPHEEIFPAAPLTLEAIEGMALSNNPAIGQAEARVRALRGKWVQVGLPPNPTVGYVAGEIGDQGRAGQQGGYAGQQFITAHKLERNRAVVAAEIDKAQAELTATRQQVQTDVRLKYYAALVAQRRLEVTGELVGVSTEAVKASKSLVEAQEVPVAGLLQTEIQEQNAIVLRRTSENALERAWRQLAAVAGTPGLPRQPLEGDVTTLPAELDWQSQLMRLQSSSPEVATAIANVERAQRELTRARVEPVPNVSTQVSVQQDTASDTTIAGVQVGIPLPIWNRNQGGIRQAQAEVTEANRNLNRIELSLEQRLAEVVQQYADARVTASTYSRDILSRSERTLDLIQQGYEQGEVGYLDLLTAQRTYFQTNLAYLDALNSLWESYLKIDGLLLSGSLDSLGQQ
jgi:cobalt-zinc-cadmium efflux system outer membrane protein